MSGPINVLAVLDGCVIAQRRTMDSGIATIIQQARDAVAELIDAAEHISLDFAEGGGRGKIAYVYGLSRLRAALGNAGSKP